MYMMSVAFLTAFSCDFFRIALKWIIIMWNIVCFLWDTLFVWYLKSYIILFLFYSMDIMFGWPRHIYSCENYTHRLDIDQKYCICIYCIYVKYIEIFSRFYFANKLLCWGEKYKIINIYVIKKLPTHGHSRQHNPTFVRSGSPTLPYASIYGRIVGPSWSSEPRIDEGSRRRKFTSRGVPYRKIYPYIITSLSSDREVQFFHTHLYTVREWGPADPGNHESMRDPVEENQPAGVYTTQANPSIHHSPTFVRRGSPNTSIYAFIRSEIGAQLI